MLVSFTILRCVFGRRNWLFRYDQMVVERTGFALWNMETRVILLRYFRLESTSFLLFINKFLIYTV